MGVDGMTFADILRDYLGGILQEFDDHLHHEEGTNANPQMP